MVSVIVTSSMDTAATEGVPSTTVYNRINRDDPETLLEFEVTICILNTNAKIAVCRTDAYVQPKFGWRGAADFNAL